MNKPSKISEMELIYFITLLCFISSFIHQLTKPIVLYLTRVPAREKQIFVEIKLLRSQISRISSEKNLRDCVLIERKIVQLEQELMQSKGKRGTRNLIIKNAVPYGALFFISFLLVIISIYHRKTPVIVFESDFNFAPFGVIMRYPTSIDGAISVPFWVFVSTFVSRSIASYVI